ncbi:hypothetical protein ES703_106718 [subsurface metagenome]
MLIYSPKTAEISKEVKRLMTEIEDKCQGRFFCFYQNQGAGEEIDRNAVIQIRSALKELGHVKGLTVLIDSPGGDADAAFHLIRAFRQHTESLEVIVANWAKSGATLVCLGADKILMGEDSELGPLDAQLRDPRGSAIPKSALNAFKSLEYLQRYTLDTLNLAIILFLQKSRMDIPYAIQQALPFVSCIATPLYQQVEPSELGEARRHLAVAEEYGGRIMSRYGYSSVSKQKIGDIVNKLVWEYPSHSFVIDVVEAQQIGLKAEMLDDTRDKLCNELLSKTRGCIGFISSKNTTKTSVKGKTDKSNKEGIKEVK